jgi:hypothetical protein
LFGDLSFAQWCLKLILSLLKRQRLALVSVGAVGTEELLSLMSQYVVSFINEAAIYVRRGANRELRSRVANARTSAYELFSRFRLHAIAKRGADSLSFVRQEEARDFTQRVSGAIFPLLPATDAYPTLPNHIYVSGPVLLENWSHFDKWEVLSFEGWETQTEAATRKLYGQLRDIDGNRDFTAALCIPAANLYRLLAREKTGAANEFSIINPTFATRPIQKA